MIKCNPILLITIILLIASCKEKDILTINGTGESADAQLYFPLKIGSYWIYQTYTQNDTGFTSSQILDSVYIEKDTIIHGNIFYKYNKIVPNPNPKFRRDSSGYIVDENGIIYFSINNFTDTLHTEIDTSSIHSIISFKMQEKDTLISTIVGNFSCYNYKGYYYSNPPYSDLFGSPRLTHDYYAPSVGLLKKLYFYSASPYITEKRLVRFYIAQ